MVEYSLWESNQGGIYDDEALPDDIPTSIFEVKFDTHSAELDQYKLEAGNTVPRLSNHLPVQAIIDLAS